MTHHAGAVAGFWFDKMPAARRRRIRKLLSPFARRAVHLVFADTPLLSYNEPVARLARRQTQEGIRAAEAFGADVGVIHLRPPVDVERAPLAAHREAAIDLLRDLADYARRRGVRLALETMYPRSIHDFAALIHDADHPALGATLDIGHVVQAAELDELRQGKPDRAFRRRLNALEIELIDLLGPKLFHMHLHGLDPVTLRDHYLPDTGVLDVTRIFAALGRNNYDGMLSVEIEVRPVKTALRKARRYLATAVRESAGVRG